MSEEDLAKITCSNFGIALAVLLAARTQGLRASYHPDGGDKRTCHKEVTHTVFLMGLGPVLNSFAQSLKEQYGNEITLP